MMSEGFGSTMPEYVTPSFAASFIAAMGVANLSGRLFWPVASDVLAKRKGDPFFGRKTAFTMMWGLSPPLYLAVVWSVHEASTNPGILPLSVFTLSVMGILSSFGGAAATSPALMGDLFGLKNVATLAGRQLSVVLPAAFLGPKACAMLREDAISASVKDLASKVDPQAFQAAFGAGIDQLESLAAQKTVTISRLMELVPEGTVDPTPFVYDHTMLLMLGLQSAAVLTLQFIKPVPEKFHEK